MGFFKRVFGPASTPSPEARPQGGASSVKVTLLTGDEPLEVVGVEDSQDALWKVAGVPVGSPVDLETYGILVPEADDPNAVSVWVGGGPVGYLGREDAERLRPGLVALMRKVGHPVALTGKVVGCSPGMVIFGGVGSLSVTLFHDPADFGLAALSSSGTPWDEAFARSAARPRDHDSGMSWADGRPLDPAGRVPYLRALLERGKCDLVDRHFMFNFLEEALYKLRDTSPTALTEFDAVCERHHLEMLAGIGPL